MKKIIEKRINELAQESCVSKEIVGIITRREFKLTQFEETQLNFYHFLNDINADEVSHCSNLYLLSKEG